MTACSRPGRAAAQGGLTNLSQLAALDGTPGPGCGCAAFSEIQPVDGS